MQPITDSILLALERLWNYRLLVIWAFVGLAVATTLAASLSLYVDATNTTLLAAHLSDLPYAFRFRYLGAWEGNITQADMTAADLSIAQVFAQRIGLPIEASTRFVRGGSYRVSRGGNTELGVLSLGMLEGSEAKIRIAAGAWGTDDDATTDGEIPALLPVSMLYRMGVQVNDVLNIQRSDGAVVRLRVAALWEPVNPLDPCWIFVPRYFDEVILLSPDVFWQILDGIERPVDEAAWFLVFDGSGIRTADVAHLTGRISDGERTVSTTLPGISLDQSPAGGLDAFTAAVSQLTRQLLLIVLPVGGLVLYFVSLIAGQLISRQQNEDVILRSRGMSRRALLAVHGLMWFMLTVLALGAAWLLSPLVVTLIGKTTSFLRFDGLDTPLPVVFTPEAVLAGVITGGVAASSGLLLARRTSRETITSYRRTSARATRAWWQRMYLDVMVFIPSAYGLYTLWQRGGIRSQSDSPFSDPLIFLGPTAFSLSLTLLLLRLIPTAARLLSSLVGLTTSIALLMALRELNRSIARYRGTLLMMGFTLSLMGFTASMASTIDRSLADAIDYDVGADVVMITASEAQTEQGELGESGQPTVHLTGYNVLPPDELLTLPGVRQVSRVRSFPARLLSTPTRLEGRVLGVDRAAIAAVAHSRADYAAEPFADVFNQLAGSRTGAIINTQTATQHNFQIGQEIDIQISALDEWYQTRMPIVGMISFFPTLDPNDGFFLITTLDPLFELAGTPLPFEYWLDTAPGTDRAALRAQARQAGYPIVEWRDPETELDRALASPSRRGVLGFLSIGFTAALVLTLISAVVQISAAFQAQSMQLGSLRAMGLGAGSVGAYMILLQGMITAAGIGSGMGIGVVTAWLFLPLLDFSDGVPPYLVRVAWREVALMYGVIAAFMLLITLVSTLAMSRQHLSAVLKMGDV